MTNSPSTITVSEMFNALRDVYNRTFTYIYGFGCAHVVNTSYGNSPRVQPYNNVPLMEVKDYIMSEDFWKDAANAKRYAENTGLLPQGKDGISAVKQIFKDAKENKTESNQAHRQALQLLADNITPEELQSLRKLFEAMIVLAGSDGMHCSRSLMHITTQFEDVSFDLNNLPDNLPEEVVKQITAKDFAGDVSMQKIPVSETGNMITRMCMIDVIGGILCATITCLFSAMRNNIKNVAQGLTQSQAAAMYKDAILMDTLIDKVSEDIEGSVEEHMRMIVAGIARHIVQGDRDDKCGLMKAIDSIGLCIPEQYRNIFKEPQLVREYLTEGALELIAEASEHTKGKDKDDDEEEVSAEFNNVVEDIRAASEAAANARVTRQEAISASLARDQAISEAATAKKRRLH